MHFNQLVCGTWLRFFKFTNYTTFKFCVPYWFICAWNQNFSTNAVAIVERKYCCALLTRNKWIVIHRALLSASTAKVSCSICCCSLNCFFIATSRSARACMILTAETSMQTRATELMASHERLVTKELTAFAVLRMITT